MDFDFNESIELENERVLVRPMIFSDKDVLLKVAAQSPTLVQYSPYYIHTPEFLEEFISNSLQERQNQARYPFVIFDKVNNAYAGSTSLANISNKDKRMEIGWTWIGNDFQKTGLNRHCKFLLLQFIFDWLGFERVEFRTDERNTASRTAMEKMGAQYEGSLRSHTLLNDGFRRTTVYYSILRNEWDQLKKGFLNPPRS